MRNRTEIIVTFLAMMFAPSGQGQMKFPLPFKKIAEPFQQVTIPAKLDKQVKDTIKSRQEEEVNEIINKKDSDSITIVNLKIENSKYKTENSKLKKNVVNLHSKIVMQDNKPDPVNKYGDFIFVDTVTVVRVDTVRITDSLYAVKTFFGKTQWKKKP